MEKPQPLNVVLTEYVLDNANLRVHNEQLKQENESLKAELEELKGEDEKEVE